MRPLVIYVLVSAFSLFGAVLRDGGLYEVFGRVFSVFLSLPWCLVADHYKAREGTNAALLFVAGGMLLNSLAIWLLSLALRKFAKS